MISFQDIPTFFISFLTVLLHFVLFLSLEEREFKIKECLLLASVFSSCLAFIILLLLHFQRISKFVSAISHKVLRILYSYKEKAVKILWTCFEKMVVLESDNHWKTLKRETSREIYEQTDHVTRE